MGGRVVELGWGSGEIRRRHGRRDVEGVVGGVVRCEGRLQKVQTSGKGCDWSMREPLALLTGHVWSLNNLYVTFHWL